MLGVEAQKLLSSTLVAGAIGAGIIAPPVASALFPYMFYALFFVVLFSLASLGRNPVDVVFSFNTFTLRVVLWQLVLLPLCLVVASRTFDIDRSTSAMLLVTATAGSVFASPALVRMVGLNEALATNCMLVSTLLMPVSVLVFGKLSNIIPSGIAFGQYVNQLNFFLIIPLIFAIMYYELLPRFPAATRKSLTSGVNWMATIAMMVFCAGAMHSLALANDHELWSITRIALVAIVLPVILFGITLLLFSRMYPRNTALLAGMLTANRNVALGVVLLDGASSPGLLMYVAFSQFPIFLFPLLLQLFRWQQSLRVKSAPAQ